MGGGVLDPDNPYFIPFKLIAGLPVILVGMAAAPLVVSGVSAGAYRLLNPAATLGGLAQKGFQIRQRGQRLKAGLTVLGLTTGTNIHHDIYPSSSSGGGGPGGLPNLHQPPPSIEEVGKIVTNPPVVADSKPSRKVSKGKKPKRCPKGKRWSRRLRRCVDAKLFPPGFVTVRALANDWQ